MKVKALKKFWLKNRLVNVGDVVEVDEDKMNTLKEHKFVVEIKTKTKELKYADSTNTK